MSIIPWLFAFAYIFLKIARLFFAGEGTNISPRQKRGVREVAPYKTAVFPFVILERKEP